MHHTLRIVHPKYARQGHLCASAHVRIEYGTSMQTTGSDQSLKIARLNFFSLGARSRTDAAKGTLLRRDDVLQLRVHLHRIVHR